MNNLERLPRLLLMGISTLLVLTIGVVDYWVKIDLSLAIFYVFPIALAAWFVGRQFGFLCSLGSATAWWIADVAAQPADHPLLPYWNALVRLGFFLIITWLLTELKASYQRERHLARTDELTGLMNRYFFLELLQLEIQRSQRRYKPFTLAYLDLDNFKAVNDRQGHQAGDLLLKVLASSLCDRVRACDAVSRLGGDEFAILLPETGYAEGQVALRRIQKHCMEQILMHSWPVTLSIGAVTFAVPPASVREAMESADQLMYTVKASSKNALKHELIG